jgi:hypothetical protein
MAFATVMYTQILCVNKQIKVHWREWNPTFQRFVCSFLTPLRKPRAQQADHFLRMYFTAVVTLTLFLPKFCVKSLYIFLACLPPLIGSWGLDQPDLGAVPSAKGELGLTGRRLKSSDRVHADEVSLASILQLWRPPHTYDSSLCL